ncbi:MAG: AAA family ATPase [Cyanobacteria bacterium]|nr:AAA family ATPase [Cyanobacteriota bacterium]
MAAATLPPLVEQMLQPAFYPHPVVEPIALLQTHVSYVFLTGEVVYKLKKPVNFGFLDYSTPEKRRECCDRELELNRRSAADLYLEVVAIAPTEAARASENPEQFALTAIDDPAAVDYAVKMRQFPQETLLSAAFDRGEVTEATVIDLARVVAEFHQSAPTDDYIASFGAPERVKLAFDENFAQTEGYIGGPQTQEQFDATKAWTEAFFEQRSQLLRDRAAGGFVRNCHGDLHLGNICQWQGRPMLFDCIEFNEPFRFVDVMYDVAFTVMDLEARGRADLANAFLNEYCERTGDWDGLHVLPLYLSRQTYVRAKVTSFLLGDPAIPQADRDRAATVAANYYRQAADYSRDRAGHLWIMSGLSGSGKSTVAQQIARRHRGVRLRSDAVRKHLGGVPLDEKGPQTLYSAEMTEKTYGQLTDLGLALAQAGYDVILDAKYDRHALRQAVLTGADQAHLPATIVHCTAPLEVLRDRLQQRQGDIADATADLLDAQAAAAEPFGATEATRVFTVDTTQSLDPQLEQLAARRAI